MSSPKRNIYLMTRPIPEAVAEVIGALDRGALIGTELVPSQECSGRVLAAPVHARLSSPTFHSAAMDGIAVRAAATFGAREGQPILLEREKDYLPVNTGNAMPGDFDAVIMIEHVAEAGEGRVSIEAPVFPWHHVRRIGEDIVATELLFPRNHLCMPYDAGALLTGGIWEVPVWERVRVRIVPTGDEVLDFTRRPDPGPGQVVESNSQMLAAQARQLGCLAERVPPVSDRPEALHQALVEALESDAHIVIFCAGSSAGSKDFTRSTFEREGKILVHGIAAMPGKPSILAECRGKLAAGAPGYPVSAAVCFEELIAPVIRWLAHLPKPHETMAPVTLTRALPSRLGFEDFVRLAVGRVGDRLVGTPLPRGAGNITTLSRGQAVLRIPSASEGIAENTVVSARLTVPEQTLDELLVCVGSHDNLLDLRADEMMAHEPAFGLVSTHAGSMGGFSALLNRACHMAGSHLFDPDTEDFNFPFLEKYAPGLKLTLINLAIRHQGIIVAPGNPKGIRSVGDFSRAGVRFINRQRGAGTRILLDWHLKKAGLKPESVDGYAKEESTHMAVAVNVLTGAADCGLGIHAAAKALGLDFVPLARERYDLLIPDEFLNDARVQAMLEIIRGPAFTGRVAAIGGYETTLSGRVMRPGQGLNP